MSDPTPSGADIWLPQPGTQATVAPPPAAAAQPPTLRPAPGPPPPGGPGRLLARTVVLPAWLCALGVLCLVAAIVACGVLAARDTTTTARPAAPAGAAVASGEGDAVLRRPLRDPFEVGGVRWAVFVDPKQSWTAFADELPAGAGQRWVLVSVRLNNLARAAFAPTRLPMTLRDATGRPYPADPSHSTLGAAGPMIPPGTRGQVELAYRVPTAVSRLELRFPAGPGTTVAVPVGVR